MNQREKTRAVRIQDLILGGNDHVIVQSMCNIKTSKVDEVIDQILQLEKEGCELIRVSILDKEDARAIKEIKKRIHIPIVADIHFDHRLALEAIKNGIDKIRLNPGNISDPKKIEEVVTACKEKGIPIRIGINSGSIEKDLLEAYGNNPKAMIESARRQVKLLEDLDFHDIILSFKSSNPLTCIEVYRKAAEEFDYPLHLGVTEAGTLVSSAVKSSVALGNLLLDGIGNTIRISIQGDPVKEIPVALELLKDTGLRKDLSDLVVCPGCGRTQWDMEPVVKEIEEVLKEVKKPIKVAIMGCIVNGPGEAAEADLAICGGKGKGMIIKKGETIATLPIDQLAGRLKEEIAKF